MPGRPPLPRLRWLAAGLRIAFPTVVGRCVWWQEDQPAEDGRRTVMRRGSDGALTMLLPPPWSARTRVHEYGGLSYLPVPSEIAASTLASGADLSGRPAHRLR